mmetsp:Transcript_32175/g.66585  ORF Transcript_32175/g.66585 Transcript_32175/m.66585 type:complete len:209 (-) Transcript_32175:267-893(-)
MVVVGVVVVLVPGCGGALEWRVGPFLTAFLISLAIFVILRSGKSTHIAIIMLIVVVVSSSTRAGRIDSPRLSVQHRTHFALLCAVHVVDVAKRARVISPHTEGLQQGGFLHLADICVVLPFNLVARHLFPGIVGHIGRAMLPHRLLEISRRTRITQQALPFVSIVHELCKLRTQISFQTFSAKSSVAILFVAAHHQISTVTAPAANVA